MMFITLAVSNIFSKIMTSADKNRDSSLQR